MVWLYAAVGFGVTIEHFGAPDGATFVKLIIRLTSTGYTCFRRIDHTLVKLGWTKKNVTKCTSLTANALYRAKVISMMH